MFTQHFIVEGRYLGASQRGPAFWAAEVGAPASFSFFCPVCADLWARCPVERSDGSHVQFMVWTRVCRKHSQSSWDIPGSLWMAWEKSFNDSFPREVLLREMEVHLDTCKLQE